MNRKIATILLLLSGAWPALAPASDVIMQGKVKSKISAFVKGPDNLLVTDANGNWFDQGLAMQQLGGWDAPYEVEARLKIVSSSGVFQVRMDEPLQIRRAGNAAQAFREPKVTLGADGATPKALSVGADTQFKNPAAASEDTDSIGYYALAVSARPPEGDFKSTAGTYSGVLSLTFEPVAVAP